MKKELPNWMQNKYAYNQKYASEHYKRFVLLMTKDDTDIIDWLNQQPNKNQALKDAIREYLKK